MRLSLLPFFIGLRYTRSREKQGFLSLLSWFCLAGMALGVAALIIVLSVLNGFQFEVRDRLLNLTTHGEVIHTDGSPLVHWQTLQQSLQKSPGVLAAAPMIGGDVMLSFQQRLQAAVLQGVDVAEEEKISQIDQHMLAGSMQALADTPYGIVLGALLAQSLGVYLGDKLLMTLPEIVVTPFGSRARVRQFTVVGIFEVGADVDMTYAYIRLKDAQALYHLPKKVQKLRFLSTDIMQVDNTAASLQQQLGDSYRVNTWMQQRQQLFAAIQMEKKATGFMLAMVVLVAACNLVSLLSMMVANKRAEIAVLRMMGLSQTQVLWVFLTQGLGLSLLGLCLGLLFGVPLAMALPELMQLLERYLHLYLFDPDVFYISGLPSVFLWTDMLWVIGLSLCLSFIFSIYPALKAGQIQPVEALQYA